MDHLQVPLEKGMVRHVEACNGCIRPDLGLGDMLAEQVGCSMTGEMRLDSVE